MATTRNDFIDRLQYVGLRLVNMTMHCWPIELNLAAAKALGNFMFAVDRKHRDRAMGNLRRSFPEMPERQLRQMARRSMQQLFMLFVEVLFTTRLVRIETIAKIFDFGEMGDVLRMLLDRKRGGMILLTGHYGNWEITGYALATLGLETMSVARPLDNKYVNEWLLGVRERRGQRIVAKKGATEIVTSELERGGVVAFIADQNAGPKGLFVDFFGRKASTYKSIALLAMQYKVPIGIGYARRVGDAFRFHMAMQDIIYPADWEHQPDPMRYITQRYTKAIEDLIRADPGQYLWVHRRWKSRPKGERPEKYD